jgi:hypothetical protein
MENKSQVKRPAEFYAHEVIGTHHPYINVSDSMLNPMLTNIRRGISSFNPFAYRQLASQDRQALGLRYGNKWYNPDIYPNYVTFERWLPAHFDPLAAPSYTKPLWSNEKHAPVNTYPAFTAEKLPRGCVRTIQNYQRCEMVNGTQKCGDEAKEILEICPNWALEGMKEKTKWIVKVTAMQNNQYFRAMQVSEYNKGRSVKDVSDKTWIDGTRVNLRPDTMWADQRYGKISQAEINDAKKRVEQRAARKHDGHHDGHGHGHGHGHGDHGHYDFKHVATIQERPLYP